jgi:hypothetical protein
MNNSKNFYLHLSNWAEFLAWLSFGIALSFLSQISSKLVLIYPMGIICIVTYFTISLPYTKSASLLRIAAALCSLLGFWNLFWLYRDSVCAVLIASIVLLVLIGGYFLWRKKTGH